LAGVVKELWLDGSEALSVGFLVDRLLFHFGSDG